MTEDNLISAGPDTGKAKLDIALRPNGETLQVDNTRSGHRELLAFLTRHRASKVGIEASDGYERLIVAALCAAGFAVILLQPRQVQAFARYKLRRAKNDRLVAGLIAESVSGLTARQAVFGPHLPQLSEALRRIKQIEANLLAAYLLKIASAHPTKESSKSDPRKWVGNYRIIVRPEPVCASDCATQPISPAPGLQSQQVWCVARVTPRLE